MKNNSVLRIIIFGALAVFISGTALAQAGRGIARLGGFVLDKGGNPVAGAVVKITFDQPGGSTFDTKTTNKGEFNFLGLGTGGWIISVTAKGYIPSQTTCHVSQIDKNPRLVIKLEKQTGGSAFVQDESSFQVLDQANQFYKDEKYDTALVMYQEFLTKNPGAYQVILNIGDCYREKGDYDKAIENYNKLIESAKADPAMGKTLGAKGLAAVGLCYLKQGKIAESQDFFKKSIEMAPQDETLPYNVAEIYFSNQQVDDAIRYYEMAIQIKADWPDPYLRLAYAYLNKGDMSKAADNLEKFIKLEPNSERTAQAKNILDSIKK